ncbi:MAG: OsmC family peroxiredoxin [Candidatus Kariarchaeaceae archaeon]|jgi:osmotically inducible protein OsmC
MTISTGKATWEGNLKEGKGTVELVDSGIFTGPFTHASRFINGPGDGKTNPEELIGAAHAGCFAMFLSALLTNNGTPPTKLEAKSRLKLDEGPEITKIKLIVEGEVPGIDQAKFEEIAQEAKEKCPVSKALSVREMLLEATLK